LLRISRLTDYGTVVLAYLARRGQAVSSAADVATATGLGVPTVSKLLKTLGKAGLVRSTRGPQGGYRLARAPADISARDVIDALEGPVSITDCSSGDRPCELESHCHVGTTWQRINVSIRRALADISLLDLQSDDCQAPQFEFAGLPINVERKVN